MFLHSISPLVNTLFIIYILNNITCYVCLCLYNIYICYYSDERRFGSLRRLAGGWRTDEGATSLDRKYLQRLLRQEAVVPVPTAQFRSYRRVDRGYVLCNIYVLPALILIF